MDAARKLLYGGAPEDFVATRHALARQARAAKDRELARRIEGLRKPSRSAWLVNQLARDPQADLGELFSLGPLLAQMHTAGSPEQLRELTILRRRTVAALVARAVDVGRSRGQTVTEPVRREVETCLEAALSHPEAAKQVLQGCLVKAPTTAAAFPMDLFEMPPAPATPGPDPTPEGLAPVIPLPRDDEEREQAKAEREKVRAERERQQAEREAQRARAHALAERVQALENRLSAVALRVGEAVEQEAGATARAQAAASARELAARRVVEAQQCLQEATREAEEAAARHDEATARHDEATRGLRELTAEQERLAAALQALREGVEVID